MIWGPLKNSSFQTKLSNINLSLCLVYSSEIALNRKYMMKYV